MNSELCSWQQKERKKLNQFLLGEVSDVMSLYGPEQALVSSDENNCQKSC
jgi:hypothetical protein